MRTKSGRAGERETEKITVSPVLSLSRSLALPLSRSLALCLSVSLSLTAFAQSGRKPQGKQQQGEKTLVKIETRKVDVPNNAYDPESNYVNNLKPEDVLVMEEGEARHVTNLT